MNCLLKYTARGKNRITISAETAESESVFNSVGSDYTPYNQHYD